MVRWSGDQVIRWALSRVSDDEKVARYVSAGKMDMANEKDKKGQTTSQGSLRNLWAAVG